MKKRLLGIILPLLAGTTMVGGGFAAFYFTQSSFDNSSFNSVPVDINEAFDGAVTVEDKSPSTLFLDSTISSQANAVPAVRWMTGNQVTNGFEIGIQVTDLSTGTLYKEFTGSISCTVALGSNLASYVGYDSSQDTSWTVANQDSLQGIYLVSIDNIASTQGKLLVDFPLKWIMEPKTQGEKTQMEEALKDQTIAVTVEATYTGDIRN